MRKANIAMLAAMVLMAANAGAQAGFIAVYGGPTYDAASGTGMVGSYVKVNEGGIAVGNGEKYSGGVDNGGRGMRGDASGVAATELGNLGTDSSGRTNCAAGAINDAGTVVGSGEKYVGGVDKGSRAIRWDASGAVATELGNLGTVGSGFTRYCCANAINGAGTAVGSCEKYSYDNSDFGTRAVRWDAAGTAATELGNVVINTSGATYTSAYAINSAGTAVGSGEKYVNGVRYGYRAIRWDASGTAATELGILSVNDKYDSATAINDAGTAVGSGEIRVGANYKGTRAVRWDASGTAATELGNLGTDPSGSTSCGAYAINRAGTIVGGGEKFVGGVDMGPRAIRWGSSGTAATELGNLGTDSSGRTFCGAGAINGAGIIVGASDVYIGGANIGRHAVFWGLDGAAVDLNSLIDPASGWILVGAADISDTGWVAGMGLFDPDGTGPLAAYQRGFLIQLPEPGTLALLTLGGLATLLRRRKA